MIAFFNRRVALLNLPGVVISVVFKPYNAHRDIHTILRYTHWVRCCNKEGKHNQYLMFSFLGCTGDFLIASRNFSNKDTQNVPEEFTVAKVNSELSYMIIAN
jgi:hypothetical protein